MKKIVLLGLLTLFFIGCATTDSNPVKKTVDNAYNGSKTVEKAVWDAM